MSPNATSDTSAHEHTGKEVVNMGEMLATPNNMAKLESTLGRAGFFAYSPCTGEQYSATPGDYWDLPGDEPLRDSEGEPMVLAYTQTKTVILQEANLPG